MRFMPCLTSFVSPQAGCYLPQRGRLWETGSKLSPWGRWQRRQTLPDEVGRPLQFTEGDLSHKGSYDNRPGKCAAGVFVVIRSVFLSPSGKGMMPEETSKVTKS